MHATDCLRAEHEIILDVLSILETLARDARNGALDLVSAREALVFFRNFADRCHHTKEEQHFFPALAKRGLPTQVGPLAVMLAEHDTGRALLERMAVALHSAAVPGPSAASEFAAAASEYVTLMRDHIAKENNVLFAMGDGLLNAADQAALVSAFERIEHEDMAPDAHAFFLELARKLCARHGVIPGAGATATGGGCCGHVACHQ